MPGYQSNKRCLWKSVAAGALGGLAGSFAMNQFQSLVSFASKVMSGQQGNGQPESPESSQDDDATVKTAKAISEMLFHHRLAQDEKKWAGPLVHYSLGTILGAVYGVLAETVPVATSGAGAAYGTAVWLSADEIAVPVLGLSQSPGAYSLSSHANALAAHLVFGVTTELTRKLIL